MANSGFDQSFWEKIAANLPELLGNPGAVEQLVDRFAGQYLPVLLRARAKEDSDRVWLAFWSYLVAPSTRRRPFGLSPEAADRLIADFQKALSELG